MANKEMQLVSRIIYSGELSKVVDWGITSEDFLTNEGRALYNHLSGYYMAAASSGSVIGPEAMAQFYPNFVRCDDPGMTMDALCTEVRRQRLSIEGQNRTAEAMQLFAQDPEEGLKALSIASSSLNAIGFGRNNDRMLGDSFNDIRTKYHLMKSGVDLSWGTWPWQPLQEATGGLQVDDYICFYGRPKSMKSWVLAYYVAYLFNCGRRILIYTKEMTQDNIFQRVIACIAQIDYSRFRAGRSSIEEEQAFELIGHYIRAALANDQIVCLSGRDAPKGGDNVPWLRAKIEKYKPDLFAVDGLYLMADVHNAKKDHERVRNISRDLRQMILDTGVPGIVTLQANRAAAKNDEANLDEVAFSDGISMDCTAVIRVINEKDTPTIQLVVGGSREWNLNGIRINGVPANDFSFHSPLSSKEIEKAKENDTAAEDSTAAHVKPHAATKKKPAATELGALGTVNTRINQVL